MKKVYLSLGSNIEPRKEYLERAIEALSSHQNISSIIRSPLYETPPWGYVDQEHFINLVLSLSTTLEPLALLILCQVIEENLGRKRDIKWGPRTIDIDIIHYEGVVMESERLSLPHPLAHHRRFVIEPLHDLTPDLILHGKKISEWLDFLQ